MGDDFDGRLRNTYQEFSKLDLEKLRSRNTGKYLVLVSGISFGFCISILGAHIAGIVYLNIWAVVLVGLLATIILGVLTIGYLEGGTSSSLTGSYATALKVMGAAAGLPFFSNASPDTSAILRLRGEVHQLRKTVAELSAGTTQKNFDDLVERLSAEVASSAALSIVEQVERRLELKEKTDLYDARHAMQAFSITRERVTMAILGLGRRGALNLFIGGFITLGGAAMLWYFVVQDTANTNTPIEYAMHFIPRLSIVIIVQVFALFFLKLYKVGLDEIKFFQNELTNIEQREIALSVALLQDDPQLRSEVLLQISKTDRNNVLEKGQSTIELEKARIDAQGGALETLKGLLPLLMKAK